MNSSGRTQIAVGRVSTEYYGTTEPGCTTRHHVLYATGQGVTSGHGRTLLTLKQLRSLRPGSYTLTLRNHGGRHRVDSRSVIALV
jgi:hypothetical protein